MRIGYVLCPIAASLLVHTLYFEAQSVDLNSEEHASALPACGFVIGNQIANVHLTTKRGALYLRPEYAFHSDVSADETLQRIQSRLNSELVSELAFVSQVCSLDRQQEGKLSSTIDVEVHSMMRETRVWFRRYFQRRLSETDEKQAVANLNTLNKHYREFWLSENSLFFKHLAATLTESQRNKLAAERNSVFVEHIARRALLSAKQKTLLEELLASQTASPLPRSLEQCASQFGELPKVQLRHILDDSQIATARFFCRVGDLHSKGGTDDFAF